MGENAFDRIMIGGIKRSQSLGDRPASGGMKGKTIEKGLNKKNINKTLKNKFELEIGRQDKLTTTKLNLKLKGKTRKVDTDPGRR